MATAGQVKVLRAVASFELAKGMVVLAAGCGVLLSAAQGHLRNRGKHATAPPHQPRSPLRSYFLDWADTLTDRKLWAVSV